MAQIQPPIWREGRLGLEFLALQRSAVFRGEDMPDGAGQPVLLIPGLLAGDPTLGVMAGWLARTGHHPSRAHMTANVACSSKAVERLEDRLESLVDRTGQRAAIVGHSRGGMYAKVLAVRRPDLVSGIVTMGTPLNRPLAVHPLVGAAIVGVGALGTLGAPFAFSHRCLVGDCCTTFWDQLHQPIPRGVAYVSLYSRSDGIVRWRSCLDEQADQIEVKVSHCGMAASPQTYEPIAQALTAFRRRDARRKPRRQPGTVTQLRRAA